MKFDSLKNIKRFFELFAIANGKSILTNKNYSYINFPNSIWPNLIYDLKIESNKIEPWIKDIQQKIKNQNHPKFIMCNEIDTSISLMRALKKYQPNNRHWASMTYDLSTPIIIKENSHFTIKQINNKKEIDDWNHVAELSLMQGNKLEVELFYNLSILDSIEFYLGYENKIPVAVSMLFVDENWAGIYFVGTLPAYERKGYGKAMTQFAMKRGLERGCKEAVLQATMLGKPLYKTIGYDNRGRIELFNLEKT